MSLSKIYRFRRQIIDDNHQSLYNTIRFLNDTLTTMDNVRLRHSIVNYIPQDKKISDLALQRKKNCRNIKEYCAKFIKGQIQDDEIELSVLARECHLVIHVLLVQTTSPEDVNIRFVHYGDLPEPYEQCIFILYDENKKHYDALYVQNKEKVIKRFHETNREIFQVLKNFIRDELHYRGNFDFLVNDSYHNDNDDFDRISHIMVENPSETPPPKRKEKDYDSLMFGQITKPVSQLRLNEDTVPNKRLKLSTSDNVAISTWSLNVRESEPVLENPSTNVPTIQSSVPDINAVGTETLKFEYEPPDEFRGRLLSELQPKKASEPVPLRYFSDERNNSFFNLLIRNTYLTGDKSRYRFEICIITPEINGYRYIHPLFQFLVHSKDSPAKLLNPIYLYLNNELEVTKYSEEFLQLLLQFVIVMHTQKVLMTAEQPLKIFSSPKNDSNGTAITTIFHSYDEFVYGYDLDRLHFAVTPWSKSNDEESFHRDEDKQYISRVCTQNKETKVGKEKGEKLKGYYENLCNSIFQDIGN